MAGTAEAGALAFGWPVSAFNATFLSLCQHCRGCCTGNKAYVPSESPDCPSWSGLVVSRCIQPVRSIRPLALFPRHPFTNQVLLQFWPASM